MPRIESGSGGGGEGFSIPFKAVALVGLIACGIGYIVYQYEQLHPAPSKPAVAKPNPESAKKQIFEKLALTDAQKNKLAQLERQSTDPQQLRRAAMKELTPEQKAHLKDLLAEAQAKRAAEREQRQARMNKYFPGASRQLAESKNKELQARTQARRAAANAASASASPKP